jgi:hypothetical protein
LKGATVDESLLHWIEDAAFFKTLDRCDAGTVGVHCGINAAGHSLAVNLDRAAAAQALTAALTESAERLYSLAK